MAFASKTLPRIPMGVKKKIEEKAVEHRSFMRVFSFETRLNIASSLH